MYRLGILLFGLFIGSTAMAQDAAMISQEETDAQFRALVAQTPLLDYELESFQLNSPVSLVQVSALAQDSSGNLYVLHRNLEIDPVIVADPAGNILRSFGQGLNVWPHGIRIDDEGNVWTVDSTSSVVLKFTAEGELLLRIEVGELFDPGRRSCAASDVAFGLNGHVYVSDGYCNSRVVEYDAAGNKVRQWGGPGNGPGEFNLLHAIAVNAAGNIYVADRENGRVQWFDAIGNYLGHWYFGGRILSLSFTQSGELYIGGEPKGATPMQEGSLIKVDPQTGVMLGRVPGFAHALNVNADGDLLAGSLTEAITLYRKR